MDLKEALDCASNGDRITRQDWRKSHFFKMEDDGTLQAYQEHSFHFNFSDVDFRKTDWFDVHGDSIEKNVEMTLLEAIPRLRAGIRVYRISSNKDEEDICLELDNQSGDIIQKKSVKLDFCINYKDMIATDWVVVDW